MKWNPISNVWNMGCIAGLVIAGVASGVRADGNDQVWLTGAVKYGLTEQVSIKVAEQIRFKDETFCYHHTDLGIGYEMNQNWTALAVIRTVEKKNTAGQWKRCDGTLLDLIHTAKRFGAELKSRMRLAYFDPRYDADCSADLRPRFDLGPAKGFTRWKLKPYVADEIMFNIDDRNLYRNRVIAGLKAKPHAYLSMNLFIMDEQTETNGRWVENWNVGMAATLAF